MKLNFIMKGECVMLDEYDFSKAIKNPYTKSTKKQITINIDVKTIEYFKNMSMETNIPYQTLMNLYLTQCATENKHLSLSFK